MLDKFNDKFIASSNSEFFKSVFEFGKVSAQSSANVENGTKRVSKKRICFAIVGIFCFAGCTFQLYIFLSLFLSYPTRTEVSIVHFDKTQIPAVTICYGNRLRKSKFCGHDDRSCDLKTLEDIDRLEKHIQMFLIEESASVLKDTGHSFDSILSSAFPGKNKHNQSYFWSFNWNMGNCFTINSNLTGDLQQFLQPPHSTFYRLLLKFDIEDSFFLKTDPSVQLIIHDSYDLPDPFVEGFPVLPGYMSIINVKKSMNILLGDPYEPHCVDYKKEWLQRGKKGPISRKMCEYECYWKASMDECGCVAFFNASAPLTKQVAHQKCTTKKGFDIENCGRRAFKKSRECLTSCPLECVSAEYESHAFEKAWPPGRLLQILNTTREEYVKKENTTHTTEVYILYDSPEIVHSVKKPQFQHIELYGYIGGYLGMWMGVSLLNVFHGIFLLVTFIISKFCPKDQEETPVEKY